MNPRHGLVVGGVMAAAVAVALTAWWGVASGVAGGFAWAAVVADPLIAAWFLVLTRAGSGNHLREKRHPR